MGKLPGTHGIPTPRIWTGVIPGSHEPGFQEQPLKPFAVPLEVREVIHRHDGGELYGLTIGECRILLGHEPAFGGPLRWHLTISHPDRHPSWDEIKTARYRLLGPDTVMVMVLPKAEHYVNAHNHVFQLWQLLDDEADEIWRLE